MDEAESMRQARREACRWRDILWRALLQDLEKRDPSAARAARAVTKSLTVRPLDGVSTREAALAWPYLDYEARADWVWICKAIQHIWIRGAWRT